MNQLPDELLLNKKVLRIDEVMAILGCSKSTVLRMLSRGEIEKLKTKRKILRFKTESIKKILQK